MDCHKKKDCNCKNKRDCKCCQNSICEFLKSLEPNTTIDGIIIEGIQYSYNRFLNFHRASGIATFIDELNNITFVDCSKIDAITVGEVCDCKGTVEFLIAQFSMNGTFCPNCTSSTSHVSARFNLPNLQFTFESTNIDAPDCAIVIDPDGQQFKRLLVDGEGLVVTPNNPTPQLVNFFYYMLVPLVPTTLEVGLLSIDYPSSSSPTQVIFFGVNIMEISDCIKFNNGTLNVGIQKLLNNYSNEINKGVPFAIFENTEEIVDMFKGK